MLGTSEIHSAFKCHNQRVDTVFLKQKVTKPQSKCCSWEAPTSLCLVSCAVIQTVFCCQPVCFWWLIPSPQTSRPCVVHRCQEAMLGEDIACWPPQPDPASVSSIRNRSTNGSVTPLRRLLSHPRWKQNSAELSWQQESSDLCRYFLRFGGNLFTYMCVC